MLLLTKFTRPLRLSVQPITAMLMLLISVGSQGAPTTSQPRLVVIVAVDQLRPDLLSADLPGGLGRLVRQGYVYSHATLDHAVTNTCPGHLAIATGVNPADAGVPSNSFVDRARWKVRYCVEDDDPANSVFSSTNRRSPLSIRVTGVGDWLKSSSPDSRVFAIAGKDRSAIALGGQHPDGAFWFDRDSGRFTSSGYYMQALPGWLEAINGAEAFRDGYARDFPAVWTHGRGTHRADNFAGESSEHSSQSGHPLSQGATKIRAEQVYDSPYLDLATSVVLRRLLQEEQLGRRDVTDMLLVSFSSIDTVGHLYGPYSAESEDTLSRLDHLFTELLNELDESVGPNGYVIVLSADHGVLPLPEWVEHTRQSFCSVPGSRLDARWAVLGLYWHVIKNFTKVWALPQNLVLVTGLQVAVNHELAVELGFSPADVIASLERYLESKPGIKAAWTHEEMLDPVDPIARLIRNSHVPGRSGDLLVQTEETCLIYTPTGTTHESPYLYDRHIPLVFYGAPWRSGDSAAPAHSIDIAPTLAELLGITPPEPIAGRALNIPRALEN